MEPTLPLIGRFQAPRASLLYSTFVAVIGCTPGDAHSRSAPTISQDSDQEPAIDGQEGDDPPMDLSGSSAPPGAARDALVAEMERELRMLRQSHYTHRTHVDEATGTFDYDCSGFLSYALARAIPDALSQVRATTRGRPRASDFVHFIESAPTASSVGRWQRVPRVAELRPGDVVAWLRPAESHSTNTGHVMVVQGDIVPDAEVQGGYVVPVMDSTALPHVPGDTRSAHRETGLGEGSIVLIVDAAGSPTRFRWSRGQKSREFATTIALGRLR